MQSRQSGHIASSFRVHLPFWHQRITNYLLAKQHKRPVLPKNQQHPMNRITDRPAVAQRRAWKKLDVRVLASFYR